MRDDVYEWFLHTLNERDSYLTKGASYMMVCRKIVKNGERWPEEYVAAKLAYGV